MSRRDDFPTPRCREVMRYAVSRMLLAALCASASAASAAGEPPPPDLETISSAALHATVFGTRPQDIASLPARVPLEEIDIRLPWARPLPAVFWFNRSLRAWFSAQTTPAPLAIIISGTGSDGNTSKLSLLRAALYGAGYHVLTLPSPTFPGFIAAASSTGVSGDLQQDSSDLYRVMQEIIAHLPREVSITDIDILGYSLGGANAAVVKSIDAREGKLKIRRAVMINPPVSLFTSMNRLDKLFAQSIGPGDAGVERLYQRLYAELANFYRASNALQVDENFLLGAAATVLKSDAEFSAAIALTFRITLVNMFFAGDLYAGTGVVVDPKHLPRVGDSLESTARTLRRKTFAEYFAQVFAPYYLKHRAGSTKDSLIADNRLDIIADALRNDPNYFAQTNSDDPILAHADLAWLQKTLGPRIVVYDHGGHLGNIGEKQQIADLLAMLSGRWAGGAQ